MAFQNVHDLGEYRVVTILSNELWKENCYLVNHLPTAEQILIDPGDNAELIIKTIQNQGAKLKRIFLTHAHHDHIGAAASVCRRFDLPCDLHKKDVRLLHHAPMYALRFAGKIIEMPASFNTFDAEPLFRLNEKEIEVIHTPGHTPGSVCYSFGGFIFTGDTLLFEKLGRTDLPGGDFSLLADSVSRLIKLFPGNTILFPGHGRTWTCGEAQSWWENVREAPPEFKQPEAYTR